MRPPCTGRTGSGSLRRRTASGGRAPASAATAPAATVSSPVSLESRRSLAGGLDGSLDGSEVDVSYDMMTRRLPLQYLWPVTSAPAGPKYLAVREHLRRRVSALPEHTLLPPEPVLCAE